MPVHVYFLKYTENLHLYFDMKCKFEIQSSQVDVVCFSVCLWESTEGSVTSCWFSPQESFSIRSHLQLNASFRIMSGSVYQFSFITLYAIL